MQVLPATAIGQVLVFAVPLVEHRLFARTRGLVNVKGLSDMFSSFGLVCHHWQAQLRRPEVCEVLLGAIVEEWGVVHPYRQARLMFAYHDVLRRPTDVVKYEVGRMTLLASVAKLSTDVDGAPLGIVLAGGAATAMHDLQTRKKPRPLISRGPANEVHSGDLDVFVPSLELADLALTTTVVRRVVGLLFGPAVLVMPSLGMSVAERTEFAAAARVGNIWDLRSTVNDRVLKLDYSDVAFGGGYSGLSVGRVERGRRIVITLFVKMFRVAGSPCIRVQLILGCSPELVVSPLSTYVSVEIMELAVAVCRLLHLTVVDEAQVLIGAEAARVVEGFDITAVLVVMTGVWVRTSMGRLICMPLALPINRLLHDYHVARVLTGAPGRHRARTQINRLVALPRSPTGLVIPARFINEMQRRVDKFCVRLGYTVQDPGPVHELLL